MALSQESILLFTTYFVATASPGPDNMAIMRTAMKTAGGRTGAGCGCCEWFDALGAAGNLRTVADRVKNWQRAISVMAGV